MIRTLYQYKHYTLYMIIGIALYTPYSLYARAADQLYTGTNTTGAIGYLEIHSLPINQLYTTIELKSTFCGNFVSGYTEQQANRFILRTNIPDPRKDDQHQCQVTFIMKDKTIEIVEEKNCSKDYIVGCSFTPMILYPSPKRP